MSSIQQDLQQEVERLTARLAQRDEELASFKARSHSERRTGRAAIVQIEQTVLDVYAAETFEEALHVLALQSRLVVGAHQAAISYVPDGDFKAAVHTHSFSEKYERYNTYDVMPTGHGVWGLVVKSRSPVRMTEEEVYSHPQFMNFSGLKDSRGLEHPPMPGWLAVPMLGKDGRLLGVIQLSDKFEGDFTEDDQDQLVNLATLFAPSFELQYVNEDLQDRAASLRETTLELQRSNAELEQFAYVASHDLQEPLRMISSYVQLLARRHRDRLDSDADEFIGFAVYGANRMQTLINDLLAYSRVSTQGRPFEPVNCELVLDNVLENLKAAIADSGAVVSRDRMPSIDGDPTQMSQLFQNLIANALKFGSEALPEVHLGVSRIDGHWHFSVTDNGIGIDPKFSEKIFVMFQRLHGRSKYDGNGIGLSICKKIVERHGGRIWVEPEVRSGSKFCFTVPAHSDVGGAGP